MFKILTPFTSRLSYRSSAFLGAFALLLILLSGKVQAQCVYTTKADGMNFNDPTNYTYLPGCPPPFSIAASNGTSGHASTDKFIITKKINFSSDFYMGTNSTGGEIDISTGGSLIKSVSNPTLSLLNSNLTVLLSLARTPTMPQLSVGVLTLQKTGVSVGANSVVIVGCTLNFINQAGSNFSLSNNSLLIVNGDVSILTGNPSISGPTTGLPAGIRVVGSVYGVGPNISVFTASSTLYVCVKGNQTPSNCTTPMGNKLTVPTSIYNTCQNTALPVTLTHFDASRTTKSSINLSWTTANELNNDHFDVQRSATGDAFETIGSVKGQGNSITAHDYTFVDSRPLAGLSYYRLRQVDADGSSDYSPVATVQSAAGQKAIAFPNPSTGTITLPALDGLIHYRIYNNIGQTLLSGQAIGNEQFDITKIPRGTFFLELTSQSGRTTQRLMRE